MNQYNRGAAGGDLLLLVLIFVFLFIVWAIFGGPDRESSRAGSFINALGPLGGGEIHGPTSTRSGTRGAGGAAARANEVTLHRGNAQFEDDPQVEYVELRADSRNSEPVIITGWTLANAPRDVITGGGTTNLRPAQKESIPTGTEHLSNTGNNPQELIKLKPGDRAFIITGESPQTFPALLNTSFRNNICTGYFADAAEFKPDLEQHSCPDPDQEEGARSFENQCVEFIERLSRCEVPDRSVMVEKKLSNACRAFIKDTYDYQGCAANHRADEDFLMGEWYVYLGRTQGELWDNDHETITLFDNNGEVIDQISWE